MAEDINVYTLYGSGKITVAARRPLTDRVRRMRSMPQLDSFVYTSYRRPNRQAKDRQAHLHPATA